MNFDTAFRSIMSNDILDLALRLAVIAGFVWSLAGAVVFVIKATRAEKLFGAEFDPEKPTTTRRK